MNQVIVQEYTIVEREVELNVSYELNEWITNVWPQ